VTQSWSDNTFQLL